MANKITLILLAVLLVGGFANWSLASGGGAGGSGSGAAGGGTGGGGGDYSSSSNYAIGQSVFFKTLHCEGCPLAGLPLDQSSVSLILPLLDANGDLGKLLSYRKRYAVQYFLRKRFNL